MANDILTNALICTATIAVAGIAVGGVRLLWNTGDVIKENRGKVGNVLDSTNRALDYTINTVNNLNGKVDNLGVVINKVGDAADSAEKAFGSMNKAANNLDKKVDKLGNVFDHLYNVLKTLDGRLEGVIDTLQENIDKVGDEGCKAIAGVRSDIGETVNKFGNTGCETISGLRKDINDILNEITNGNGRDKRNIKELIGRLQGVVDRASNVVAGDPGKKDLQSIVEGLKSAIDGLNMDVQIAGGYDNFASRVMNNGHKLAPGTYVKLIDRNNAYRLIPIDTNPNEINLIGDYDTDINREIIKIFEKTKLNSTDDAQRSEALLKRGNDLFNLMSDSGIQLIVDIQ